MDQCRFEFAWCSDKGRVRVRNEDAVEVHPDTGVVVIADGIGGSNAGEVASHLATQTISQRLRGWLEEPPDSAAALFLAERAVEEANHTIWEASHTSESFAGMGTTVVLGLLREDWLVFAYVGDSRLYRLRGPELEQLTRDHSLIQEVVDQGFFPSLRDAQRYGINENVLTRGLGAMGSVEVDIGESDLRRGDIFLFCTDGLTGMVPDEGLRRALIESRNDLSTCCRTLIDLACDCGGFDNITVALVRVD